MYIPKLRVHSISEKHVKGRDGSYGAVIDTIGLSVVENEFVTIFISLTIKLCKVAVPSAI